MSDQSARECAEDLSNALTQWTLEPLSTPRNDIGLTPWAEKTMNLAGDLCEKLGVPSPFFGTDQ